MANVKYYNKDTLLTQIQAMDRTEFQKRFPGVVGRKADSYSFYVGQPVDIKPVWHPELKWSAGLVPVERVITYKSQPSRHECDARCMNATGRTMQCECACGGKNHGRFSCS